MNLTVSTPALLFPAVSLLFLAYTNRFLHLAALIRSLFADYEEQHEEAIQEQIKNLQRRLVLIRWMQLFGAASLLFCVTAMVAVMFERQWVASGTFIAALVLMGLSLLFLLSEIYVSGGALRILLDRMDKS
ncbi:MAG: DUF2721 domain-containing protein [Verrucomicrobiota bacterium]